MSENSSGKLNLPPLKRKPKKNDTSSNVIITPPPKTSDGSTANTDKDREAMAKVQKLLENTPVASLVGSETKEKVNEFNPEELSQERSQKWLEQQVDILNRQVEDLENEIIFYKKALAERGNQNPQIMQNPNIGLNPNAGLENSVLELFKHFETLHLRYNHDGNFSIRVLHPASGNGILDKLIEYIPFLHHHKRF